MSAPFSHEEAERLAALERYRILDTPPAPDFDALTELASYICQAPVALVSLVDENRQWFKSQIGLGLTETARDVSICAHAIRQPGLFIVPDTTKDERFARNPLVTGEPHLRFYAGSLLTTSDGHALGTLCVLDRRPRELDEAQKRALEALSRQAMALIELHLANVAKTEMLQELQRAADEKALLLRELEHRVKNHLQLVSSVLNLQTRTEQSPDAQRALASFGRRLKELGVVTSQLQGQDVGSLNLAFYLKRLTQALVAMHAPDPEAIQAEFGLAPVEVPAATATPLGLILNEFVTNSFKYAFLNGRGVLCVMLERSDERTAVLRIADNGPGLQGSVEGSGLGTQIIPALAQQIGGMATFGSGEGCSLTVEFRT